MGAFLEASWKHCVQVLSSILYCMDSLAEIDILINTKGLMQKRIEDVIVYYKLAQAKSEDRQ